jgi:hypothetical protein
MIANNCCLFLAEEIDPLGAASTTGIDIQKQENLAESTYCMLFVLSMTNG